MKSKVKIKRSPENAIKELNAIAKRMSGPNTVKVGLPKGSNDYPDGISVIMVGAVHEFGSPVNNVPQRSFLRSTVQEKRREYKQMFSKLADKMISGKMTMLNALQLIGLKVQSDVQQKIGEGIDPPLQYREGTPLIDTGHLRQSITYQVEE